MSPEPITFYIFECMCCTLPCRTMETSRSSDRRCKKLLSAMKFCTFLSMLLAMVSSDMCRVRTCVELPDVSTVGGKQCADIEFTRACASHGHLREDSCNITCINDTKPTGEDVQWSVCRSYKWSTYYVLRLHSITSTVLNRGISVIMICAVWRRAST